MSAITPAAPPVTLPALVERERRRRRHRIEFWVGLAVAVPLLLALAWAFLRPRPVPLDARFRSAVVARGDILREVRATGHLEAYSTVDVGAEISGRIASVAVDFNDQVRRGQVLARFDRNALEAQVAQTDANIAAARAALAQAKIDAAQAKQNFERTLGLFQKGYVPPAENETSATTAALAAARVEAAAAQLAAARAAGSLARTNLSHSIVSAPIDGMVIARNVDPGQTVVAALQTPVLFTVAADLRKMKVLAAVDEADVGEVKPGQTVLFGVSGWPDRTFRGSVVQVRNSPAVVQDVVTYATEIEVANDDLALKPGMTASVRIRTAEARGALVVPNGALRFTPPQQSSTTAPALWTLEGSSFRRIDIVPGITDGEHTEVSGAPEGAKILVDLSPEGKKIYGVAAK